MAKGQQRTVRALKVHQWLDGWNNVKFSSKDHRSKPKPYFYLFSLPAVELRSLCGIVRRDSKGMKARASDLGIQRQHDPERSDEIGSFVQFGYPWSTLTDAKRKSEEFNDLRKPGWLPTAIVINILGESDAREGQTISKADLVQVGDDDGPTIKLPYPKWIPNWKPSALAPFEVIDGQHRLWAFDNASRSTEFEVPVVAFHGLDISWQAYLFWTINIKPKRINASLAFDLYPLLRGEDWLDRAESHPIYRETRAQELTEALWSHPESPWYDRINMLGEREIKWVSQSAWIRSLLATFVRPWQGRGTNSGGLFGSRVGDDGEVLGWNRAQQAAFLIFAWQQLLQAVKKTKTEWTTSLREDQNQANLFSNTDDLAFYSSLSLISTDQGVRGYLHVVNDLTYFSAARLKLDKWQITEKGGAGDVTAVTSALKTLTKQPTASFVSAIAVGLATFDWRTSNASGLTDAQRRLKLVFRGSSGYKELRKLLLEHLTNSEGDACDAAKKLVKFEDKVVSRK